MKEIEIWIDLFSNDPRHIPRFKIQQRPRTRSFKSLSALYWTLYVKYYAKIYIFHILYHCTTYEMYKTLHNTWHYTPPWVLPQTWVMMICRPIHTHSLFFFSLSLSTLSLMHSLSLVLPRSLSLSLCLSFYDISWMKSNFLLSLIEKHLCFDVWKSTYLLKHTPSHTVSSISPITQMSHKHPVQLKKTQKSHSNTLYGALWHCHNAWKKK